eukprot:TRINITY_DN9698_c0_g2_i2.p1 TRINITY_DN9698_c0_g2~~TRINITY_DN9698_c0_g2_i2.p1  ORF type:complete len:307 (+),score=47.56 TRINITY_DN9698_c0_g2_i2:233-1153(+)
MGCGQSAQPDDTTSDNPGSTDKKSDPTPVEAFDASPVPESPKASSSTSGQAHHETIAPSRDQNVRRTESAVTSPEQEASPGYRSGFPAQQAGVSPVVQEQALPNPFARQQEQIVQQQQPGWGCQESMAGVQQGGYVQQKDTKKRGGFDPERFRQANARGRVEGAGQEFNMRQETTGDSWAGGHQGMGMMQSMQPMHQHKGMYDQQQPSSMEWPTPPAHQPHQQPDFISASEYGASSQNLQMDFRNPPSHGAPSKQVVGYGALGWDTGSSPLSDHAGPRVSPQQGSGALNKTDEDELDDILQEIGDL